MSNTNKKHLLLQELEKNRIKTEKKSNIFSLVTLLIILSILFYNYNRMNDMDSIITLIILLVFIGGIVYVVGNSIIKSSYHQNFKLEVIKPLIESINETFIYRPDRKIPRFTFKKAKLFGMFNIYYGDDFVSGEIDGVKLSLSELSVFDERNAGKEKVVVKIFDGIFSEFDFNKHFSSTLLIYPDVAQKYFGHLGQWLQSMNFTKDQLIKLDNPEFEKYFVVYGTDQVEARYLLTPSMMEYIVNLRKRVNVPIYISFSDSKLYIAFEYDGQEQFEPDIHKSLLDETYIGQHMEKINYHIEIIENFKLNKFLWSKHSKNESVYQLKEKQVHNLLETKKSTPVKQITNAKDTHNLFYKQTSEVMKSLDKQRTGVFILKLLFNIAVVVITIMLLIYIDENVRKNIEASVMTVLFAFIGALFANAKIEQKYKDDYKSKLVSSLVKHINSKFIYEKYNSLAQKEIYKALLFEDWSSYYGDDLIKGEIGGLKVIASELDIELENKRLFKGYFFIFDLEDYTDLDLRIFPKNSEFDTQESNLINLDSEIFSAYGEDTEKLLSKEFISKLVYFYTELRVNKIFTSFMGSKLYIGFDFDDEDFFEGDTSKSVFDEDKIMFYIIFFKAVEELIMSMKSEKSKEGETND